jgi:lipopolysaccharide/colanic/teichoic acid biosynthesis glycosyltransferase
LISDRGTVFYVSKRLGRNGKIFKMVKFRTMKMNSKDIRNEDGSSYNSKLDSRFTKIGRFLRKTSIDEIPQILNVLKGDMSIIGPRPDLPDFYSVFTPYQLSKLSVLPGITGYNQAYYRNSNNLTEKFNNDVYYVNNISFRFDIMILCKTIITVVLNKNLYKN